MSYPSPCEKCAKCTQPGGCAAWKVRYLYRQKQISAYARRIMPGPDCDADRLRFPTKYEIWLKHGPCRWCQAADHCDTPCPAYWRWWDERMRMFRRMLYG